LQTGLTETFDEQRKRFLRKRKKAFLLLLYARALSGIIAFSTFYESIIAQF